MAPTDAVDTRPYSSFSCLALALTNCSIARRSFRSSSSSPASSAALKTIVNTPCCVSLRLSRRPSNSGPMSDTVARTGWPDAPNRSQNTTGHDRHAGSFAPMACSRWVIFGVDVPASGESGKVTFDVRHECRHTETRKPFGEDLQRHGLAGASSARDQTVAVGHDQGQRDFRTGWSPGDEQRVTHDTAPQPRSLPPVERPFKAAAHGVSLKRHRDADLMPD